MTVTGESGAGMVRITMTCKHEVKNLEIDESLVGDDKEMLEDLIIAAFNDAVRRVEKTVQEKFSGMTAGLTVIDSTYRHLVLHAWRRQKICTANRISLTGARPRRRGQVIAGPGRSSCRYWSLQALPDVYRA
jgi:hypothetical protein